MLGEPIEFAKRGLRTAPMTKAPAVLCQWRLRNVEKRGGWEVLSWTMTEGDAAEWARNNKVELEKVSGSREDRQDHYGTSYESVTPAPGKFG